VGDAARAIHPMAGQGLNLGLYDVAAVCDLIAQRVREGGDIGNIGPEYGARWSRHSWPMISAMEVLRGVFASDNFWVRGLRKHGMWVGDKATPLQQAVTAFASGNHVGGVLLQ